MRTDRENKKSRAGPFYWNGVARFSIFCENVGGCLAASTDFWTLKNGKIYMGNRIGTRFVVLMATIFQLICIII
jgi:hypothetical protein